MAVQVVAELDQQRDLQKYQLEIEEQVGGW
jgi:hypothetical protein